MTPWLQRLSVLFAGSLLLAPGSAVADPGGSTSLEVIGWDPVDRKVFVAEHIQEAGLWLRPALGMFLLDAEDPSLMVRLEDPADLDGLLGGGDLMALRRGLEPLVPVEPVGLEIRERLLSVGPCADVPASDWQPPCRDERVLLVWLGQVHELHLTGWGGSEVLGAYAVPGTDYRLVVHSHLAPGGVMGLPQEAALLFGSPKTPAARPPAMLEAPASIGSRASLDPHEVSVIRQY